MKLSNAFLASLCLGLLLGLPTLAISQEDDQPGDSQPSDSQPSDKDVLLQAYELTKGENTVESLTQVIEMCGEGLKDAADDQTKEYGTRLLAWAHNKRGEVHAAAETPDEEAALADFEASIKIDGSKWKPYHNRGVSYGLKSEFEKAEADFSRVIEMNPNYAKAYFNRGEVRTRLPNQMQEAIRDYSMAIRLNPEDSAAYNSRGFALYSLDPRDNRAFSDYNQAIRLDQENYEAYTNRGNLFADRGRLAEAIRDFQEAIRINPEYGLAYLSAAWFRATCPSQQFQSGELALRSAKKAIELDGESARYLDVLAAAHARAGDYEQAIDTAKKALEEADESLAEDIQKRLALYEDKKPYVDVLQRSARRQ
jgi:tetratricopeptide (TPR) repeat protein